MPELPDIAAYISALESRVLGQVLERVRVGSVFLLRTVEPPLASVEGRVVREIRRVGKRIAVGVDGDLPPQRQRPVVGDPGLLWLVLHLMIAGRRG